MDFHILSYTYAQPKEKKFSPCVFLFSMQNVKLNHYIAVFERVVLLCKICEQQTSNRIESLAIESGCIRE